MEVEREHWVTGSFILSFLIKHQYILGILLPLKIQIKDTIPALRYFSLLERKESKYPTSYNIELSINTVEEQRHAMLVFCEGFV